MTRPPKNMGLTALVCLTGLAVMPQIAQADTQYKFNGFGTIGGAQTTNDDTGFRANIDQTKGAGKKFDLGVDSRLAFQASALYDYGFALTAQLLGRRGSDGDFDAGFEWLYAQYTGVNGLDVKLGRVVLPAFLVSDSRMVGYSVPWVRVPPMIYSMMPLTHLDGGQAGYRHALGSAVASVQVTGGRADTASTSTYYNAFLGSYPSHTEGTTSGTIGINGTIEWNDWTFRLSQITAKDRLISTVELPLAFGGPVDTPLNFKDKFQEIGLQYDDGKWLLTAEQVKRTTRDQKVQDAKAWYVGGGYHFGAVLPYVLVSRYKESFSLSGITPPAATSKALGARYDFAPNLDLKAEWAQYRNSSTYVFTDVVSPAVADKKINVLSLALDFVF